MIDIRRYNDFSGYMNDLLKSVQSKEFKIILETKLFDLYKHANADEIKKEVIKIVNPKLEKYFSKVKSEYDEIIKTVNTLYSDISGDVTRDMSNIRAIETINKTNIGKYEKTEITRITDVLSDGLLGKKSFDEIKGEISKISDKTAMHSEALAKTQMKAYGRAIKSEKSFIGEIDWHEYIGLTKDTNRAFCTKCLRQKMFRISVILKLDNGASQPKPVYIYCGGWVCIHDWEPDPFYKK